MFHGLAYLISLLNPVFLILMTCYMKFHFMMDHWEIHSCLCSKYFAQWLMFHGLAYLISPLNAVILILMTSYTKFQFMMDQWEIHSCLCRLCSMADVSRFGVSNISSNSSLFEPYDMLYKVLVYDGSLGDPLLFMQ